LSILPYSWIIPDVTLHDFYLGVHWTLSAAVLGKWPRRDFLQQPVSGPGQTVCTERAKQLQGEDLAGGIRIGFTGNDGDYKWHKETFKFDAYNNNKCCHRCGACKDDIRTVYTDFTQGAGWRGTIKTTQSYFDSVGAAVSPLALVPGWTPLLARTDIMHNLFAGSGNKFVGSALVELVQEGRFGGIPGRGYSWARALKVAWLKFKRFCRKHGLTTSQPVFTRARLNYETNLSAPSIKAKAFDTRVLIAWCSELCIEAALTDDSLHAQMRASTAWGIAEFCRIIELSGRHMTPTEVAAAREAGQTFLQCFGWLAREAIDAKKSTWPLKPKMHQFDHLLDDLVMDMLNPRFWWNFGNEDFLGTLKRIAQKCARKTLAESVLRRYLIKLALRWRGRDRAGHAKRVRAWAQAKAASKKRRLH